MKKGQVFILIAFIICIALAELGNIYTYSSLPSQTEQAKTSASIDILKNIQNEISFVGSINEKDKTMLADFSLFVKNFTLQKNYLSNVSITDFEVRNGQITGCDYYVNCNYSKCQYYTDEIITVQSIEGLQKVSSKIRKCWS